MEKADVLEMTVHYLRERKRLEQKHQGIFLLIICLKIVCNKYCLSLSLSPVIKEMIYHQYLYVKYPTIHFLEQKFDFRDLFF